MATPRAIKDISGSASKYTIYDKANSSHNLVQTSENYLPNYKNAFVEQSHDFSELSLILPDDCLVMVGPPRLPQWASFTDSRTVGFLQNVTISQQSAVQPLKAIGSRRHIFAKTNQPVSIQINRMMFTAGSLLTTLYGIIDLSKGGVNKNSYYNAGEVDLTSMVTASKGQMLTNIEEDLYRIPFGLRMFLGSPSITANAAESKVVVPSLLAEGCTLQAHTMSLNAGEAMVMEQVSIYADRVIGFPRGSQPAY